MNRFITCGYVRCAHRRLRLTGWCKPTSTNNHQVSPHDRFHTGVPLTEIFYHGTKYVVIFYNMVKILARKLSLTTLPLILKTT
jgi:hypothetical protein